MSYLLKALEKAQKEREASEGKVSAETAPVVHQARLPLSLMVVLVLILGVAVFGVVSNLSSSVVDDGSQKLIDQSPEEGLVISEKTQAQQAMAKQPSEVEDQTSATNGQIVSAETNGLSSANAIHVAPSVPSNIASNNVPLALYELDAARLKKIPSIQFQSHIYSSSSEYRSVMLNDRTMKEGVPLAPSVYLQEITPTGVVLNVDGVDVQLPKGQDWIAAQ